MIKPYVLARQLNQKGLAEVACNRGYMYLDQEQAMGLIVDLIELFHVDKESIECIYFPEDSDRATVLRAHAEILDKLNDRN